jgi:hypothetical protein
MTLLHSAQTQTRLSILLTFSILPSHGMDASGRWTGLDALHCCIKTRNCQIQYLVSPLLSSFVYPPDEAAVAAHVPLRRGPFSSARIRALAGHRGQNAAARGIPLMLSHKGPDSFVLHPSSIGFPMRKLTEKARRQNRPDERSVRRGRSRQRSFFRDFPPRSGFFGFSRFIFSIWL